MWLFNIIIINYKFICSVFRKKLLQIFVTIIPLAIGEIAYAACTPKEDFIQVYWGSIGPNKIPITVALKFEQNNITGIYSYKDSSSDLILKGKLLDEGNKIELEVVNDDGAIKEKFIGNFPARVPLGRYKGTSFYQNTKDEPNICDFITGEWFDFASQKTYDFSLHSSHSGIVQLSNMYYNAGVL